MKKILQILCWFKKIKLPPEKIIKFKHIKEPITFKQMTGKKGALFWCENCQKNFKSLIKSKGVTYQQKHLRLTRNDVF